MNEKKECKADDCIMWNVSSQKQAEETTAYKSVTVLEKKNPRATLDPGMSSVKVYAQS